MDEKTAERCRLYRERHRKQLAERSRLYRQRHKEEISQRRKEIKQQNLKQMFTVSKTESEDIEDDQETSKYLLNLKAHTERQQRYYEKHREEINKRRKEKRQEQSTSQKIPTTAAERNRSYRERNKQEINERRREKRRKQQNSQPINSECNISDKEGTKEISIDQNNSSLLNEESVEQNKKNTSIKNYNHMLTMYEHTDSPQAADPKSDEEEKPRGGKPLKEMRKEFLQIEQRKLEILEAEEARSSAFMKTNSYQFLMSLLPEIEKLPTVHKMRLRMKISKAVLDEVSSNEREKFNQEGHLNDKTEGNGEPINMYE